MTTTTTTSHKPTTDCWCGCGGRTKSRFVPGHDAKFHSRVKQVLRGFLDADVELARLPHDASRAAFLAYADKIQPSEDARAAKLATATPAATEETTEETTNTEVLAA